MSIINSSNLPMQGNLGQWLRDPMTEKLLSFVGDRKNILESMIISGVSSLESYREYCGEWKGLNILNTFILVERGSNEESS